MYSEFWSEAEITRIGSTACLGGPIPVDIQAFLTQVGLPRHPLGNFEFDFDACPPRHLTNTEPRLQVETVPRGLIRLGEYAWNHICIDLLRSNSVWWLAFNDLQACFINSSIVAFAQSLVVWQQVDKLSVVANFDFRSETQRRQVRREKEKRLRELDSKALDGDAFWPVLLIDEEAGL